MRLSVRGRYSAATQKQESFWQLISSSLRKFYFPAINTAFRALANSFHSTSISAPLTIHNRGMPAQHSARCGRDCRAHDSGIAAAQAGHFVQRVLPFMTSSPKDIRSIGNKSECDPLLTPEQVAKRLNASLDWVWDHSSRKLPLLPVIRFGDGPGRAGMLR